MNTEDGPYGGKITVVEYIKRRFWSRGDNLQAVVESTLANLSTIPVKFRAYYVYYDEDDGQWMAGWAMYKEQQWDRLFAAAEASKTTYDRAVTDLLDGVEGLLDEES